MKPQSPRRQLVRHLTLAEGLAALWSLLAGISVGAVSPLVVLPRVAELLPAGSASTTVALALNPWLGALVGTSALSVLAAALFWPMAQQLGRTLLVLSLVMSLSGGFFVSWALSGALGA